MTGRPQIDSVAAVMGKVDNLRIAHAALGTAGTARLLIDAARGRRGAVRPVLVSGLDHPFHLTGELSDLEMLAEARQNPLFELARAHVGADATGPVVDIGANVGTTATLLASLLPHTAVFAVEPDERNRRLLERNAEPYGDRIHVVGAAVTVGGGVAYQVNPEAAAEGEHCGLRFDDGAIESGERPTGEAVRAMTLDEVVTLIGRPARLPILKLDVEGGERELATAGLVDVLRRTDAFVVETHDRFRAGSTAAVTTAATEAGLRLARRHGYDHLFLR